MYRREPVEPSTFYCFLANDTIEQLRAAGADLRGLVLDVGGGPGYLADAVRAEGGRCIVADSALSELGLHDRRPQGCTVGDGRALPVRDGGADVVHCSNVLEHVRQPEQVLAELTRALRPGGIGYMAFTPWLSPWGGHETSPWHYAGGARAARRYERRVGQPPKNVYDSSLFRLHVPRVRAWFASNPDVEVLWQGPRYWPPAWRGLARVPVLGEVLSWNHLVIFQRSRSA